MPEQSFDRQKKTVVQEIENDGVCYISAMDRDEETGVGQTHYVGIFRDGEITDRREYAEDWLTVSMYFARKRSGYTKKAFRWFLDDERFGPDPRREPSSLKKLYETGRL